MLLLLCGVAAADTMSRSPDGRYAVTGPDSFDDAAPHRVVELATGKPIATLQSEAVFKGQSHATLDPRWTRDGKTLLWYVDGKWGSTALELVRFENGKPIAQIDVRERVVLEVLAAVRTAAPRAAAIAKQRGQGSGRWFREGLAIDVRPAWKGAPVFPLRFEIELTSDPKCLDDYPRAGRLGYRATATLDATGKLVVGALRKRGSC